MSNITSLAYSFSATIGKVYRNVIYKMIQYFIIFRNLFTLQISTVAPTEDIFAEAAERQRERKEQLEKYCLEHVDQNPQPKIKQLWQLLFDDDNKYIYCAVPKSASTPMKKTLLKLRNDSKQYKKRSPHEPSLWKHMSEYNESENSKRLQTHFKFLFVREPFHRLLSAYLDKLFDSDKDYSNRLRQLIVKTYRPEDMEEVSTESNNVTFTEFLRFILTSSNIHVRDNHWRQYEYLCFPCFFKFDFIGHFETLEDDVNYVLKKAGFNKHVTFPPFHSSRVSSTFLTYYSQVPQEIIFRLGEAFRNDFEMFGYPFPGPLKSLLGKFTSA